MSWRSVRRRDVVRSRNTPSHVTFLRDVSRDSYYCMRENWQSALSSMFFSHPSELTPFIVFLHLFIRLLRDVRQPGRPAGRAGSFLPRCSMQGGPSDRKSVRLSVRLSVTAWIVTKRKHLAKIVQLSLIGSPLRAFQWAYDQRRTLPLTPQRGPQKRKFGQ